MLEKGLSRKFGAHAILSREGRAHEILLAQAFRRQIDRRQIDRRQIDRCQALRIIIVTSREFHGIFKVSE